ncbi:MAG: carboxypeptidase regulatory-like domain-containing protein [Planctomycetaceae bacterium]|nr:carboxypeptidase regulatory-like domain-containing protein [Planctomycetaceae bacterium]
MFGFRSLAACSLATLMLFPLGCGGAGRPKLVAVEGTVTLNGAPLEGATIMFMPVDAGSADFQRPSTAVTDAQGKFVASTYTTGDGLAIGKYQLGIEKKELVGDLPKGFDSEQPELSRVRYKLIVPKQFRDPTTSGLSAEVTSGGLQPAVIELNSEGAPEIEVLGTGPASA